jgi:hypothetical protein
MDSDNRGKTGNTPGQASSPADDSENTTQLAPISEGQFKPGIGGNPGGRPKISFPDDDWQAPRRRF